MAQGSSFSLFAGSSHVQLAEEVAQALKIRLGKMQIDAFPDGETGVQILENVRGKDVFVLQSAARQPNHYLMELLVIIDALKRSSAKSVVAVLPYYPYGRQDRGEKERVPIAAKLVADLLEKAGVTRVVTMDLHTEQVQGFFNVPVDNLTARSLLVGALRKMNIADAVVVAPDLGSSRRARKVAEDLRVDLAIVDKRRVSAKAIEIYALIGDVEGKCAILVDDIGSTGATLETAAKLVKEKGAKQVFAAVTHGLFIGDALPAGIDRFLITNTVAPPKLAARPNVEIVSVASLFSEAIECAYGRN
jgi:ribose-phosphate pyrophosphokinase